MCSFTLAICFITNYHWCFIMLETIFLNSVLKSLRLTILIPSSIEPDNGFYLELTAVVAYAKTKLYSSVSCSH